MNDKEFLEHIGVLGMHWGRIKGGDSSTSSIQRQATKVLRKADKAWEKPKNFRSTAKKVMQEGLNNPAVLKKLMDNTKALARLGVLSGPALDNATQTWAARVVNEHLKNVPESYNPSKTKRIALALIDINGSTYISPQSIKVGSDVDIAINEQLKQADPNYEFDVIKVPGYPDIKIAYLMDDSEELEQSEEDEGLEHVGVLGMHWGRRKGSSSVARRERKLLKMSPGKLYRQRNKLTPDEVKRVMSRIKLEKEMRNLRPDVLKKGHNYATTVLAYGTTAAAVYALYKSPVAQTVKNAVKDGVAKLLKD